MRRDMFLFFASVIATSIISGSAFAGDEKIITINGSDTCSPASQTISITPRKIGDKFEIIEFSPGNNCTNGNPVKKSRIDLYYSACPAPKGEGDLYWQTKNESKEAQSGNIGDVGVGEGDYCLKFEGGKGGVLKIKYMEE